MEVIQQDGAVMHLGDSTEVLAGLEAESVDLVLTDPPYNVSARGVGGRANTTIGKVKNPGGSMREVRRDFGEWDYQWDAAPFLEQARRVLKPSGALIAFCSEFTLPAYLESGLDHRGMLFWRKTNPTPSFRGFPQRAVEMMVWQTKGGHWTFMEGGAWPNVLEGPTCTGSERFTVRGSTGNPETAHPTQKPLWLMRSLVLAFSRPGDLVLDPFAGTGTTVRAALDLNRRCIGVELERQYFDLMVDRSRQRAMRLIDG